MKLGDFHNGKAGKVIRIQDGYWVLNPTPLLPDLGGADFYHPRQAVQYWLTTILTV